MILEHNTPIEIFLILDSYWILPRGKKRILVDPRIYQDPPGSIRIHQDPLGSEDPGSAFSPLKNNIIIVRYVTNSEEENKAKKRLF
jgi:hypothetical protein